MEVYRCINCMKEIEKGDSLCRHCGYGAAEYTQPLNALKINTILCGRYLVGRVMGQGGFGITYVGYDLKLELKVAIKEYCPKSLASRDHSVSNVLQWTFSQTQYQITFPSSFSPVPFPTRYLLWLLSSSSQVGLRCPHLGTSAC